MTAPDPRLDEIQARLSAHVKCSDCGKCRVQGGEEWCPQCDYWSCEDGLACADEPYKADVAYLLAELRKAHEALARVEGVATDLATRGAAIEAKGYNGSINSNINCGPPWVNFFQLHKRFLNLAI